MMAEHKKTSFNSFLKSALAQLAFFILLLVLLYFYVLELTGSHTYSLASSVVFFLLRKVVSGGNLRKRVHQIESLFDHTLPAGEKVQLSEPNDEWLKGVGFINDINQPMWVRVSNGVIELFFLARSREPYYLIKAENLAFISLVHNNSELVKVTLKNLRGVSIIIPWEKEWNILFEEKFLNN